MFAKVVTASRSSFIGNGLTYEVSEADKDKVRVGAMVSVPLRNKLVEGVIVEIQEKKQEEEYDVKTLKEVLVGDPLLTEAQIKTIHWMSEYYICTLRSALGMWLPQDTWSSVLPQNVTGYTLSEKAKTSVDFADIRGKKQKQVLEFVSGLPWASRDDIKKETGASAAVLNALKEGGWITEDIRKAESSVFERQSSPLRELPILTPAQEAAYESMKSDPRPSLLFGVTGSGKTEIYAQLIVDAIKHGKQAILLVPEILLTEHSVHRFDNLLERDAIAIIHSRLTKAERKREWKRIHEGKVSLVIGSRSALFSPLKRLGVVIIDEEHEWTYKNEQTPRYHARDTAENLCYHSGAKLVLGSATPSLESWSRAKYNLYHLARLPTRYKELALPNVTVIDLIDARFGLLYPFTTPLLDAIAKRLKNKEQSVLFLNRRGIASALLCLQCRRRVVSPESQLPFTVHNTSQGRPFLLDHTSGLMADVPERCPHCQSTKLHPIGAGTQKLEQILKQQFPGARIIRADADTISEPEHMRHLLATMRNQEADILLGTQAVVKGLDLPHVTLAAVLLADIGLSLPHFRAGERIFQLLTQLTGRSGRAKPGEVIIQTFRPDAPEVQAAAKHETEKYLETELKLRQYSGYPPSTLMIRLIFRGEKPELRAKDTQRKLVEIIAKHNFTVRIGVAPTFFGGGKEWHILLRGEAVRNVLEFIDLQDMVVDVDPMETV